MIFRNFEYIWLQTGQGSFTDEGNLVSDPKRIRKDVELFSVRKKKQNQNHNQQVRLQGVVKMAATRQMTHEDGSIVWLML